LVGDKPKPHQTMLSFLVGEDVDDDWNIRHADAIKLACNRVSELAAMISQARLQSAKADKLHAIRRGSEMASALGAALELLARELS